MATLHADRDQERPELPLEDDRSCNLKIIIIVIIEILLIILRIIIIIIVIVIRVIIMIIRFMLQKLSFGLK